MPSLDEFMAAQRGTVPLDPIPLDEPVPLAELHTPALVIDLDIFEQNLATMQTYLDEQGLGLRAHTKMHKCPVVARQQLAAGALGLCAAKVSEAELLTDAGLQDILITSPLATREKQLRLLKLADAKVKVVVDTQESASSLNDLVAEFLGHRAPPLGVFVDIDPGMGRTGIEAGEPAVQLVQHILDSCPRLHFAGLQMYAGHCMHVQGLDKRRSKYEKVMAKGLHTRDLLAQAGIEIPAFSGGGTGTYNLEADLGLMTELQVGSYAFMDIEYRDIGSQDSEQFADFPVSLFVLATAISQPQTRLITVDAGFKSLASDKMVPEFRDLEGVIYHWGGDEHGIVQLDNPSRTLNLGDKLMLLTPHCDPTVNLHDYYFPYRDGMVSEIWPISARGCSQ